MCSARAGGMMSVRMKREPNRGKILWRITRTQVICVAMMMLFITASFVLWNKAEMGEPAVLNTGRSITEWEEVSSQVSGEMVNSEAATQVSFTSSLQAFQKWDVEVGCAAYREKLAPVNKSDFLQDAQPVQCSELKQKNVFVLVKEWTWIPDSLNNLYPCSCGLSCLWGKSEVLADKPDAHLYETYRPPAKRQTGDPLRVFVELEAESVPGLEDIFVSYHHEKSVQATYAGASFHSNRNYYISSEKNADVLVYWSSSRCVKERQDIASKFLPLVPHHSFGSCLNNVGGKEALETMYPKCRSSGGGAWFSNLHCGMSHYKFVLAIENTFRDSYVTEKLFYALDAGSVPIYFGAPNVLELVPPGSVIPGNAFSSMEELAFYVKHLAANAVEYAEFHAWRRCGEMGNYLNTRAVSLDTLPCRLCATVSKLGGRNATGQ